MAHRSSPPLDNSPDGNVRKRVCKACDRCRLKKSKCDGASPCGRCKSDNAICVFGERKKAHDKVYPKGYVEMLEQQQAQLVAGLQESYRLMQSNNVWPGQSLKPSTNGHPLTHDILERLGALKQDGSSGDEHFEEDLAVVQKRLIANGAGYMQRQDSSDGGSDSDHSPTSSKPTSNDSLDSNFPPTPPSHSPYLPSLQMSAQYKAQTARAQQQPQTQQQRQAFGSIQNEPNSNTNSIFSQRQQQQSCGMESQGSSFDTNMNFIQQFENQLDAYDFHRTIHPNSLTRVNPSLSPGWGGMEDDDFSQFLMDPNPTLF